MKTKFIVASAVGLLGITSMIIGTTSFAANMQPSKIGMGSSTKMMRNRDGMMNKFASTGEAEAFRTAVDTAIANNDYTAFVNAHTKYNISNYMTKEQFATMVTRRTTQENIKTALEKGDYATWKTLSKDHPIASTIDTEAKFKQLQEMYTYQEKARTIAQKLGLPGPKGDGIGMGMGQGKGMGKGRGMGNYTQNNQ